MKLASSDKEMTFMILIHELHTRLTGIPSQRQSKMRISDPMIMFCHGNALHVHDHISVMSSAWSTVIGHGLVLFMSSACSWSMVMLGFSNGSSISGDPLFSYFLSLSIFFFYFKFFLSFFGWKFDSNVAFFIRDRMTE